MNKAILIGNLTRDPEHRTTPNNISVTTFTVAVQRRFAKDGETQADFIPCVTWRNTADACAKYLQKGSKVGIIGQIQTRSYDDKNGVKRYVTEIIADEVEFLDSKPKTHDGDSPDRGRVEASARRRSFRRRTGGV
jgi:single-strand DNA-binding protein